MNVVGIDADTKTAGVAYIEDGVLQECLIIAPNTSLVHKTSGLLWTPDIIVIEKPEITVQWTRKGVNGNNLISLAVSVGVLGTLFVNWFNCPVDSILPREWKGQVPKEVKQIQICEQEGFVFAVDDKKIKIAQAPCKATYWGTNRAIKQTDWTHALDAVGIARWAEATRSPQR